MARGAHEEAESEHGSGAGHSVPHVTPRRIVARRSVQRPACLVVVPYSLLNLFARFHKFSLATLAAQLGVEINMTFWCAKPHDRVLRMI